MSVPAQAPPARAAPLIAAEGVCVRLGGRDVLSEVSLSVAEGEIVTLLGPNGSGKSTLLRTLIGALKPSAGTVRRRPGLRMGYVPQRLAIDPHLPLTVARFLDLPRGRAPSGHAALLAGVGLPDLSRRQMAELSGGQFQRVLIARALLAEPRILLLDEPTQGLDQPGIGAFYRLIEDLRQRFGLAVLLVSHDLHVVMSASDRVVCLNRHVCCEGTPKVVSEAPAYRALFGEGTKGTMALYRHGHDHSHDHTHDPGPDRAGAGPQAGSDPA